MFKEFELTLKHSRGEIGSKGEDQYIVFDVMADKNQIIFEMEDKILDRVVYVTLTSGQALSIANQLTDAAHKVNNANPAKYHSNDDYNGIRP